MREREQHVEEGAEPAATIGDNRQALERRSYRRSSHHRDRVWRAIEETPDFWTTLKPLENGAVKRLYRVDLPSTTGRYFSSPSGPATAGRDRAAANASVARRAWVQHAERDPAIRRTRRCAAALHLDYLVDDTPQNCVDVLSDSSTRAILLVTEDDSTAESSARRLGIGTAHNIHEVLDLLVQATEARVNPSLFEKLRKLVGWK